MENSKDNTKVFISYSWKPTSNKEKTLSLANRLSSDGIQILLDEWDLAEGQDKYQFMEQMVNNPEVKRVLIICNKDYSEKANNKRGGVGIESLIISDDIYNKADQTKFIPIIFEKDETNQPYVPTFIKTRRYIDLSEADRFEEEYENLLRNIYEKPKTKRPPIGIPPAYIYDDELVFLRTAHKTSAIKNALINERKNYQIFIDDYYSSFIDALKDFEITDEELSTLSFIDDKVLEKIENLKWLRNDFINFLEIIFTYSYDFNFDKFFSFFEKLLDFFNRRGLEKYPHDAFGNLSSDQFRFFYYELFLYTSVIMWEKEKFKELGNLLHDNFLIFEDNRNDIVPATFVNFNMNVESLNVHRNKRLELRRLNVTADIIKQRADITSYSFEKLKQFDVLLYYISLIRNYDSDDLWWYRWWPNTSVYRSMNLPMLDKLISIKIFEKTKSVFNVESVENLKSIIEIITKSNADKVPRMQFQFPMINQAFKLDKIATIK